MSVLYLYVHVFAHSFSVYTYATICMHSNNYVATHVAIHSYVHIATYILCA